MPLLNILDYILKVQCHFGSIFSACFLHNKRSECLRRVNMGEQCYFSCPLIFHDSA
jgi:hypothetical protein